MIAPTTHENRPPTSSRFPAVIGFNGWFSIVSGTALLAGAVVLDDWFDLPAWVIAVIGVALIPYGTMLRRAAHGEPFDRRMAWSATVGDVAWVIGAAVLIAVPNTMSTPGKWTLGIVSLAVLDFAILQLRDLRRS